MADEFTQRIDSREGLREIYDEPVGISVDKELDRLDQHCRDFLALSPFMVIGTADANGHGDLSPKGDRPGFVQVLDDSHLLIPDRPGNNRLDTMQNLIENPQVATIFFVPGVKETLRIAGRATVVSDGDVMLRFEVNGKLPKSALLLEVREVFMHCAKALARSKLWEDDYKVERSALPRYAQILADHANQRLSADEIQVVIDEGEKTRFW